MSLPWIAPADDSAFEHVNRRLLACLDGLPPDTQAVGKKLVETISTRRWFLEWNLPRWLAEASKLPAKAGEDLVLGNVFGLGFVRIQDDLWDGSDAWGNDADHLSKHFYLHWINIYDGLFTKYSPFWGIFDQLTGSWLRASLVTDGPDGEALRTSDQEALVSLAQRGAPLKICAAAAGLLSPQGSINPRLLNLLDQMLAGMVLMDHAQDWQEDLKYHRYNALAAFLTDRKDKSLPVIDKRMFFDELYLGCKAQDYFALVERQFCQARGGLQGLGLTAFEAYLDWITVEAVRFGRMQVHAARNHLKAGVKDLLGKGTD